jgi:hypothetical protein
MEIETMKQTGRKNRAQRRMYAQNQRNTGQRNRLGKALIPHPPQINGYEIIHSKTLRFTTAAAAALTISYQNLLDLVLFTTSATAPFDLFKMVKIRFVKVWAVPILGTAVSVEVMFDGVTAGSQGDRRVHTDTSMGIEPAFVTARPLAKTLAANFQLSSGSSAFFIDCPAGAVVDVGLDFKSDTLGTAVAAQNVSAGATTGVVAFRGLDGLPQATSNFTVPTGLLQI